MKRRLIVFFQSLLLANSPIYSQTQNDTVTELNPVVVTGVGTYHKADNSPVAVNVVTAKNLKDAGVTNLQDALSKLTTNITTQTNGMGSFVCFNGVSDNYILILENGKRISGDDRWNRISMNDIKRIEIFNGAASALYGSDAIAGVINIITNDEKDKVSASANTKIMSKGRQTMDVNVDVNAGKFSSFTAYSHNQADNWQVNHYQAFAEGNNQVLKLTGRPMSTGYHSDNISQKFAWKFNSKWSAYLRGNYYDYLTQRPQNATYYSQKSTTDSLGNKTYSYTEKQAYTYDIHHTSYTYGGGVRWVPNRNTHLYFDAYSDNFKSKYDYWQTSKEEAYDETRKSTHYENENIKGIFCLTDWNKLSAGLEFVQEALTSETDNIHNETTNTSNIFAQDEIKMLKGLEGFVGVRYTYNNNFGSNLTPNLGLFYHIGNFRMRASYADGFKTPTLSQLYATDQAKTSAHYTINNTNLEPEKNHFWNSNIEYSNNWMRASASGYINKIRDMINYRTLSQDEIDNNSHLSALYEEGWTTIRQRSNIDKATIKGVSTNVKFLLPYGFSISGGYTYTDSKAETKTLNKKTQLYEIAESPVDKSVKNVGRCNISWDRTWEHYHLNICLNGFIQGERYSSTYGYADGYSQWDLSTRHTITLNTFILEPGFGIENLFDKCDEGFWNSNFSTINPGRSFYVSLAIKFKE